MRVLWEDGISGRLGEPAVTLGGLVKSGKPRQEASALNFLLRALRRSLSCTFSLSMNFEHCVVTVALSQSRQPRIPPTPAHPDLHPQRVQNHVIIGTRGHGDVQT